MTELKKILYFVLLSGFLCLSATAQESNTVKVTRRVADFIKNNTSYKFIDAKTKKVYDNPEQAPGSANLKAESIYNRWLYPNGVMAIGMMELSNTLNDPAYMGYVSRNFKFVFDNVPYFQQQYAQNPRTAFYNFFRMDRLDDCGALSAALSRYNQIKPDQECRAYLQKAADFILSKQTRLSDGTLCRKEPRIMTIWADDLYMSVPFLAEMGKITGKSKYNEDAIKQVMNFNRYLYDPSSGLYYHTWFSETKRNGVAHWLRCNGWLAMAQAELISNLPPGHPKRKELIHLLLRQINGFSKYQDATGLWHQLIDKQDSYLETSGTAMFIYVVAKAVNEGWIPSSYFTIAQAGWNGLMSRVTADGQIPDVCIGTGVGNDLGFYYKRPKALNEFHVAGAFLLAGSEMIKAKK